MLPPVGPVLRLPRFYSSARQVADHSKGGRLDRYAVEGRFQFVQYGFNKGAVERFGSVQPPDPYALLFESLRDLFNFRNRAADHLMVSVVSRDTQPGARGDRVYRLHFHRHAIGRCEDRGHATLFHLRHQRASYGGKPHPVLKAEHACRLRCREFSNAVSDDHIGTDADARPERCQCALQRVEGRLLPRRVAEVLSAFGPTEHHVQKRGPSFPKKDRLTAVQNCPRHWLAFVESLSHADPLASLSGVGKRHPGRCSRRDAPICFRQFTEALSQRFSVVEDDARAVIEVAPPHARCPRHVRKYLLIFFFGVFIEP